MRSVVADGAEQLNAQPPAYQEILLDQCQFVGYAAPLLQKCILLNPFNRSLGNIPAGETIHELKSGIESI